MSSAWWAAVLHCPPANGQIFAVEYYSYQLRTGTPFRQHQGDVFLYKEPGGTRVRWAIRFESSIPFIGRLTALLLRILTGRALRNLKRLLERPGANQN